MDSVATRPIADFDAYIEKLSEFVYKTNLFMKPIFSGAQRAEARGAGGRGGDSGAARHPELVSLGLAKPILVGRPSVIEMRIQKLGLQIKAGVDFEIVNNESDPRFKEYWSEYYQLMKRRGITQEQAQRAVISNTTVIGAIMVHRGEADAMICGTIGEYHDHYRVVQPLFGYRDGVSTAGR
ncbi:NADP-dependent malic enzyme [Klebsiella pneumoniae]|nr:NADP-dependent malic enzyme [Klebsiella pneumoniae]